jgi:hypothetical protein
MPRFCIYNINGIGQSVQSSWVGVRGGGVVKSGEEGKISKECYREGVRVCGCFKSSLYSFIFYRTLSGLRGINPVFSKEEITIYRLLKTLSQNLWKIAKKSVLLNSSVLLKISR